MRRSAISRPSNVAGGFRRYHNREYKQFLHVLLGSCAELETQMTIARNPACIRQERDAALLERLDHICRIISGLLKKL
jgi:four helix bundle protein